MDFMKVFDQTVREIKREVNLKVLKVPEIEQKVLDATDNEPWGPHGSALAEIAQATKKFTECQMVMNVLWTRLGETGKDWRYVYKALAVIEYLVAHGSERAVDDIVEHTFQISALSSFEYVEPSGKDVGLNVRKKAENVVVLLNNREKIQEVRNKAAANRDKYFGLSSTGITYKSGSASFSTGSYQSHSSDKYGGFGSSDSDRHRDSYRDKAYYEEEKTENYNPAKSSHGHSSDKQESSYKKGTRTISQNKDSVPSRVPKSSSNISSAHSQSSSSKVNNDDDDFDDFDPRGTSAKVSAGSSNQVDLFGQDLIGDLLDAPPTSVPAGKPAASSVSEIDLFADAAFVSAEPHVDQGASSQSQNEVDLFASQPAGAPSVTATVDLLCVSDPVVQPDSKLQSPAFKNNSTVDPFAAVPLNNFDGSDLFGEFTSRSDSVSEQSSKVPISGGSQDKMNGKPFAESKIPPKKDAFQVKSGIWADSLSRGLIDLNISASKKVSLTDVGIVGGLSDGSDEKEKGPPQSYYMGRAMGSGSGLGMSGFTPSQPAGGDDMFASLSGQQYQFSGFQK
ncbi:clathrin interactor EPSIN 1-like [Prosopis cineraria]|uniref:clathrin interactor EPSIN 1-like n=1 Tax=Prosopis cineraria TaxID=364024 RepID=UPI00240F730A|nr:clathrin interactor EPSIN 1-like [Prosopis cineraria]XP_054819920.1 clathrin interactor EPSIN 1-like [Prosopis cineraria]